MADFIYKGHEITITDDGTFRYIGQDGRQVTKPSLKAAKTAVDKIVGAVVVEAMKPDGQRIDIIARDRHGSYVTANGERLPRYSALYPWDAEVSGKIIDVEQRQQDEYQRHADARAELSQERNRIIAPLSRFDYDVALAQACKVEPS